MFYPLNYIGKGDNNQFIMIICKLCKIEKMDKEFYSRCGKRGKHFWCKSCYKKASYANSLRKKKMFVRFCGNKCKRCGIKHTGHNTQIFDFHHKDSSSKNADWYQLRAWSVDRIRNEILKCILLCSNCHRLVHKYKAIRNREKGI